MSAPEDEVPEDGDLLTSEQFFTDVKRMDGVISPVIYDIAVLLARIEERLMHEDTHDCPADHQVAEALEQSKLRLSEGLMWLRTAIATKVAANEGDVVGVPFVHHDGDDQPN